MKSIDLSELKNHVDFGYFSQNISRKSLKRSIKDKLKAWELGHDYYDGDRNCGYGGFIDDNRWIRHLPLLLDLCSVDSNPSNKISILDIGCKKGFIVDAAIKLGYSAIGIENHIYPLTKANEKIKHRLLDGNYFDLPFVDNSFEFCIAFSSIYMQNLKDVIKTLKEIKRVSNESFISVAAYNHEWEKNSFYNWTLLGTTVLHCSEWLDLFSSIGYEGKYFFTTPSVLGFQEND
tara:strand:- start:586 stop:1284 length:699 start_codon:yes stop_codon:yes gene_type:complete